MSSLRQGSFRLFRFAGIDLFLHWSWFLVALFEINQRAGRYSSIGWNVLEYLALFGIVMTHEFGHALACRQVGGTSEQIVLWPLGGVAYVNPPPRPGATLWSIAAGPLVNVVLLPILYALGAASDALGWATTMPNVEALLRSVWYINAVLLIFNMLPIYPLDGGQILRSLLWYAVGRARSLMIATGIGFAGVAGLIALAVWMRSAWFFVLSAFILLNCWTGLKRARALSKLAKLPRRDGYACPSCETAPPIGAFWRCENCANSFDAFQTQAACPFCGARFSATSCLDCGRRYAISEWVAPAPALYK